MLSPKLRSLIPPSEPRPRLSFVTMLFTVIVCTLTASCTTLTKPSPVGPSPLVIASCPQLTPLTDASFGATTTKLVEVAGQYYECREAALAGRKVTE